MVTADRFVIIQILLVGHEPGFFVDVEEDAARHDFDGFDLAHPQALAVQFAPDIIQHVAEIVLAAVAHIVRNDLPLFRRHGVFRGFIVRRRSQVDRLFQRVKNRPLAFGNIGSHAEEKDCVVIAQFLAGVRPPGQDGNFNRRIDGLVEIFGKHVFRIIHEGDSGRRGIFPVSPYPGDGTENRQENTEENEASDFGFHGEVFFPCQVKSEKSRRPTLASFPGMNKDSDGSDGTDAAEPVSVFQFDEFEPHSSALLSESGVNEPSRGSIPGESHGARVTEVPGIAVKVQQVDALPERIGSGFGLNHHEFTIVIGENPFDCSFAARTVQFENLFRKRSQFSLLLWRIYRYFLQKQRFVDFLPPVDKPGENRSAGEKNQKNDFSFHICSSSSG